MDEYEKQGSDDNRDRGHPLEMNMSQLAEYVQKKYEIEVDTRAFYDGVVEIVGDKAEIPPYEDFGT
jgi:hypothetical protein